MKLSIIGAGHVGLIYAVCFAEKGHDVVCADIDESKIDLLKAGKAPFHEPGLDELVSKHLSTSKITYTTSTEEATKHGEIIFVCVSTPSKEDGSADMRYFESVSRDIANSLNHYTVVVEKSTVPVQTSLHMRKNMERYAPEGAEFDVASNPEFLAEGTAIRDTMNPSRIVIGTDNKRAEDLLLQAYDAFECEKVCTTIESAELIKLASNAHLAMRISFVNALSKICELGGANVDEVARGMGLDPRIGPHFLRAGIGYGGSCFPKDVKGMYYMARNLGYDFEMLRQVHEINEAQWLHAVDRIEDELWSLAGKRIALWGVSFKPGTDDVREAPSLKIASELHRRGAEVVAYDPVAMKKLPKESPETLAAESAMDAVSGADALILTTEWKEFLEMDPREVFKVMRVPFVFDGRIALDEEAWKSAGFSYHRIGKIT